MFNSKKFIHVLNNNLNFNVDGGNPIIIGNKDLFNSIMRDVFNTENVYHNLSHESVKLPIYDIKVLPISYNEKCAYFALPQDKLMKLTKKVLKRHKKLQEPDSYGICVKNHFFFVCVEHGISFVLTNDIDIIFHFIRNNPNFDDVQYEYYTQPSKNNINILGDEVYFENENIPNVTNSTKDVILLNRFTNEYGKIETVVFCYSLDGAIELLNNFHSQEFVFEYDIETSAYPTSKSENCFLGGYIVHFYEGL